MPTKEREAYREFEKALQKDYVGVRYRLRNHNGSHTMQVLTLLSKFRQVRACAMAACGCCCQLTAVVGVVFLLPFSCRTFVSFLVVVVWCRVVRCSVATCFSRASLSE